MCLFKMYLYVYYDTSVVILHPFVTCVTAWLSPEKKNWGCVSQIETAA